MSLSNQELELLDHCQERFQHFVQSKDKPSAYRVYQAMKNLGISEPVRESLEDTLMKMFRYTEGEEVAEYPTQEEING